LSEHGRGGDQGESDHQRGRGRRGAPRVPPGVLPGENADGAEDPSVGRGDGRDDRLADHRGEQRHPEENGEHARAQGWQAAAERERPHHQPGTDDGQHRSAYQSAPQ